MATPTTHPTEMPSNSSTAERSLSAGMATGGASSTTDASRERQVNGSGAAARTKTEAEIAADKLYEERMEEEYAKREGGA